MKENIIVALIFLLTIVYVSGRIRTEKDEKFDKLRMTTSTFDKMKNLHKNTYYTAVKAIIGKMGSILYKELPKTEKRLLARCLDKIEDRRELITSAKCVVTARKRLLKLKSEMTQNYLKLTTSKPALKNHGWKAFLQQFDDFDRLNSFSKQKSPSNLTIFIPKKQQQNGFFKEPETQRFSSKKLKKLNFDNSFIQSSDAIPSSKIPSNIAAETFMGEENKKNLLIHKNQRQQNYFFRKGLNLENKDRGRNPNPLQTNIKPQRKQRGYNRLQLLGKKLQVLTEVGKHGIVRFKKRKQVSRRFMKFMHRAKRSLRFPDSKDHYYKEKRFKIVTRNHFNGLSQRKSENPIISSITNVIREFTNDDEEKGKEEEKEKGKEHLKWTKTYNRLMTVRKAIDEQKRVPGAKVYEHRMFDIVLGRNETSLSPTERRSPEGIMHESMKLLGRLTSTTNNSEPFYRALSPRFMPLMPLNEGKRQPETYLSPTIMAMYDEPNKTNEISIGNVPGILRTLGISQKDRNKLMQTVLDISGSNVQIDEALKIYETLGMFDEDVAEPLLNATERIMGAFKKLEKSLFPDQKFLYDNRGFAFLKKHQMKNLLRDQRISEDEIDLADFDIYDKMSDEEMEISLWKTIENIAINKTDVLRPSEAHIRHKRAYLFILTPAILSPLLFTVQFGAVVLGPLIISPTAFAPPILNPSVLAPWILSPGIFDPFILSPYIFGPFILSPLAFTPFILTPYFLSPNILNPYLITSLILSPIGLSPDILSPMAIGANILSPAVLSPPVLNPTALTASVLSPSFLS